MKLRRRPAIWIGEGILGAIAIVAMLSDFEQMGLVAVGAIAALLPKLVESEEKGNHDEGGNQQK